MSYQAPRDWEQSPEITERIGNGGSVETKVNHPAFGQISVSRRSAGGRGVNLYDSDFGHNSFVTIEIKRSELTRDLSRDWHYPSKELVPCALTWLPGEGRIPGIPSFDRSEVFKKEMRQTTQDAIEGLKKVIAAIGETGLSKKKQEELLTGANKALRSLTSSVPFIEEQFNEHVETTVERGKQEIHGYMNAAVTRAGIAALNGDKSPLTLTEDKNDI